MKQTPLLEQVIQILSESQKPLSVPELQEELAKKSLSPNKTTLYRMLERLGEQGEVEAVLLDPKITYYELKTRHHHHFRCQNCNEISCIADPKLESQIHALEEKLEADGLKIQDHQFSLTGTCNTCS